MKALRLVLNGCILFSIFSCSRQNDEPVSKKLSNKDTAIIFNVNQPKLLKYFETDQITIDTLDHAIEVKIANSKLLEAKKKKMGAKWESPEAWISVAATYQSKLLNAPIDSLAYIVNMDGKQSKYVYSVKQLQKANSYIAICEQFAAYLNSKDYSSIKELLATNILSSYNDTQIKDFLKATFGEKKIDRTELIATKIVGNNYSFYINFWYSPDEAQTFGFVFLNPVNKIAGIQIPK